jgi:hypothetical protein
MSFATPVAEDMPYFPVGKDGDDNVVLPNPAQDVIVVEGHSGPDILVSRAFRLEIVSVCVVCY